jgi:hypothetical protein
MFKLIKKLFSKKTKEEKKEPLILKKEIKSINKQKETRDTKSSLTFGV